MVQVLSALMQRQDLTREECRAAVTVSLLCWRFDMTVTGPPNNSIADVQSLVEGEINVAQAAAFMVLLHAKV